MKDGNVPIDEAAAVRSPSVTSSSLLAQIAQADPHAWTLVVRIYGPLVYGWCRRSGLQPEDASDMVQEVFKSVYTAIGTFRRDRPEASFRSWLKTITRNKIRDFWRRQQRQPPAMGGSDAQRYFAELPEFEEPQVVEEPLEAAQVCCQVLQLLQGECEPRTWEAFRQLTLEGCAAGDVAAALGLSRNAVYIAKCRVLSRLRTLLAELMDDGQSSASSKPTESRNAAVQ